MTRDDDQLFTILLLVALGFLINHLTKPKSKNASSEKSGKSEKFEQFAELPRAESPRAEFQRVDSPRVESPRAESPRAESPMPRMEARPRMEAMPRMETRPRMESMPRMESRQEPRMESMPRMESRMEARPLMEVPQVMAPRVEVRSEVRPVVRSEPRPVSRGERSPPASPKDESNVLSGFGANDIDSLGADLQTAFDRPIPQNVNSSAVDMNKNNVKKYDAKDFLPKEINNKWFDTDFSQAKFNVNDDKLINTERYVIGINTVGQSLKNASYDIRGTIPNPKFSISPWNNSTYEPDTNLKSLC
jgi:hypothetical protein